MTAEGGSARPAVSVGQWIVPQIVLDLGGPRSALLIQQAFEEEGLPCPSIDERVAPTALLFPRSFVETVEHMPAHKTYDYSFVGGLFRPDTFPDALGPRLCGSAIHRSFVSAPDRRRARLLAARTVRSHEHGLGRVRPERSPAAGPRLLPRPLLPGARASRFALCPAGDAPWSMRFFEAIMCRSIPIVSDAAHIGRNDRRAGDRLPLLPDATTTTCMTRDIVDENFRSFVREQTLIARPKGSV